jgi:hypothetical protein
MVLGRGAPVTVGMPGCPPLTTETPVELVLGLGTVAPLATPAAAGCTVTLLAPGCGAPAELAGEGTALVDVLGAPPVGCADEALVEVAGADPLSAGVSARATGLCSTATAAARQAAATSRRRRCGARRDCVPGCPTDSLSPPRHATAHALVPECADAHRRRRRAAVVTLPQARAASELAGGTLGPARWAPQGLLARFVRNPSRSERSRNRIPVCHSLLTR